MAELQELLEQVKTYDWGSSRLALTEVSDIIKAAFGSPVKLSEIEKSLIGVLQSDATYAGKQYVCRELSIIGTEQSVPALAKMLTNDEYSDMARYALERMPGQAVDEALRDALAKTSGKTKVGIINTLGERKASSASAALSSLIYDSDKMVSEAAASALGKIGGSAATSALAKAKGETSGKLQLVVLDAYLRCADQLAAQGKKGQASAIYKELSSQELPQVIRAAAALGRLNMIKKVRDKKGSKLENFEFRISNFEFLFCCFARAVFAQLYLRRLSSAGTNSLRRIAASQMNLLLWSLTF